jgi:hypothetical protein
MHFAGFTSSQGKHAHSRSARGNFAIPNHHSGQRFPIDGFQADIDVQK